MKKLIIISLLFWATTVQAATWYVDGSVSSSGNGQSWATAWKTLANISGVSAGDTVYISGGANGGAGLSYSGATLTPIAGNAGGRITYKIGQDSLHNGIATFTTTALVTQDYVNVSGDAEDGVRHFVWTPNARAVQNHNHLRISYVDFGQKATRPFYFEGSTGVEIDHVYFYKLKTASGSETSVGYFNFTGTGAYGVNSIHDSVFYLPQSACGLGDDGLQSSLNSTDVYNNIIAGYYDGGYVNTQHGDGMQPLVSQYLRVYNNTISNMSSYGIYLEGYYGDFKHIRVYNNDIRVSDIRYQSCNSIMGWNIGPGIGALNVMGRWPDFTDIVVANNTVSDFGLRRCGSIYGDTNTGSVFTDVFFYNNIGWNCAGWSAKTGVTSGNNTTSTDGIGGSSHFVSYSNASTSNDFHLLSSDSLFKGQGADMSAYFTTDKDGMTRGVPWDIGAYASGGPYTVTAQVQYSGTPAGTISPSSAVVSAGSTTTFTITPNGTSTWTVGGTCGGTLLGDTYTTSAIYGNCTVVVTFWQAVTASAGSNGTLSCTSPVHNGHQATCTASPSGGYHTSGISSDVCGGTWVSGNSFTTGNVTADCTVTATFAVNTWTVTSSAGSHIYVNPLQVTPVADGGLTNFTIIPDSGYYVSISSTCVGYSVNGTTYTFGPVTANCSFIASALPLSTGGGGKGGVKGKNGRIKVSNGYLKAR